MTYLCYPPPGCRRPSRTNGIKSVVPLRKLDSISFLPYTHRQPAESPKQIADVAPRLTITVLVELLLPPNDKPRKSARSGFWRYDKNALFTPRFTPVQNVCLTCQHCPRTRTPKKSRRLQGVWGHLTRNQKKHRIPYLQNTIVCGRMEVIEVASSGAGYKTFPGSVRARPRN